MLGRLREPRFLVETSWIALHLGDPRVRLVDTIESCLGAVLCCYWYQVQPCFNEFCFFPDGELGDHLRQVTGFSGVIPLSDGEHKQINKPVTPLAPLRAGGL